MCFSGYTATMEALGYIYLYAREYDSREIVSLERRGK